MQTGKNNQSKCLTKITNKNDNYSGVEPVCITSTDRTCRHSSITKAGPSSAPHSYIQNSGPRHDPTLTTTQSREAAPKPSPYSKDSFFNPSHTNRYVATYHADFYPPQQVYLIAHSFHHLHHHLRAVHSRRLARHRHPLALRPRRIRALPRERNRRRAHPGSFFRSELEVV